MKPVSRIGAGGDSPPASTERSLVELRSISKTFGATRALDGVSFNIGKDETLGFVGANGAGKSTLIKILSGIYRQSSGEVLIGGETKTISSPTDARSMGIATVHQNIDDAVVFGMTVAENLLLDEIATSTSEVFMNQRLILKRARSVQEKLQLELPLTAPVEALSASGRQEVAIARALVGNAKLLILDEPTSTLSAREAEKLFEAVQDLRRRGITVLYVSHRMSEIKMLCDRTVVLRNGRIVSEQVAPLDTRKIASAILGELVLSTKHKSRMGDKPVFVGKGLRARSESAPAELEFRRGEVVGLTGLVGAGKTELLEQICGRRPLEAGDMRLHEKDYAPRDAAAAIAQGVVMVPEERSLQAIFPGESLWQHCTVGMMAFFSRLGFMIQRKETAYARDVIRDFRVVCSAAEVPIEDLSGGNQQKLLVGRWLKNDWSLVVLDEPFRGIDIGARAIISRALREYSKHAAVVVCSSDPEEVVEVADRVLIMVEGRVRHGGRADELTSEELSEIMSQTAYHEAHDGREVTLQ
ncbi:MAG: sugar ABC transporter ATP-binding protein [Albidovulum sp.]|nr:sugar ABC transporter ATP-binding protein [Albidovulum sp.]